MYYLAGGNFDPKTYCMVLFRIERTKSNSFCHDFEQFDSIVNRLNVLYQDGYIQWHN